MTYRYEWRVTSYALFMHEDYPPFNFDLSSEDDGMEPTEDTDMHDQSVSCAVDLISTLCAATTPLGETLGMSSKLSSSQTYTSRQNSGLICERRKLELVPCAELHIAW